MPQFRLHLEWDDEYADRDKAREDLQQLWEEIENLSEDAATLEVFDVQTLPAKGGGNNREIRERYDEDAEYREQIDAARLTEEQYLAGRDERGDYSLVPPMGVDHPWDSGQWIFPPDHPLAETERAAKEENDLRTKEYLADLARALQQPTRALPPPPDPED